MKCDAPKKRILFVPPFILKSIETNFVTCIEAPIIFSYDILYESVIVTIAICNLSQNIVPERALSFLDNRIVTKN